MKKWIVLAMIAALASASQAASLSEGTKEIVIEGLFDPDALGDSQLDLDLAYGYFIQDNLEVGALATVSDNDAISTYGLGGFVEYNFDQGTELVPFVNGHAGWINADPEEGESQDAGFLGASVGAKYFLAENIAVSADVTYDWATEDVYFEDDDVSDTDLTINLGMRFYIP